MGKNGNFVPGADESIGKSGHPGCGVGKGTKAPNFFRLFQLDQLDELIFSPDPPSPGPKYSISYLNRLSDFFRKFFNTFCFIKCP